MLPDFLSLQPFKIAWRITMIQYPKLGILTYKDKQIDVKITFRVKLIELSLLACTNKECHVYNHGRTETELKKYCTDEFLWLLNDRVPESKKEDRYMFDKKKPTCPQCKSNLIPQVKPLYKVYGTCTNQFIKGELIVNRLIRMRFKREKPTSKFYWKSVNSFVAFVKTYDDLVEDFELSNVQQYGDFKGTYKLKIENPFPTKEVIAQAYEDYKSWRLAKEI